MSSGKNKTITLDLKDVLIDFFSQIGQKHGDYLCWLLLVGGDGLTYKKMIQLQVYLQMHDDDLESFWLLQLILADWHGEWTDLS